jgi:tRNA modification GTPase
MAASGSTHGQDTIVAISTPPGRGGIGIVRLSGPAAVAVAARLVTAGTKLEHGRAVLTRVVDPSDAARSIDEAVVTAFLAPRSYTGEDLVEIAAHGSPVVLEALVRRALDLGAELGAELGAALVRLAEPGEFTQRAFLSGRLDLTQAEAVHDLIAARTLEQARVAAQQMGGAISRRVAPAKEALLHVVALLEAGMDFASGELDDVDVVPPGDIAAAIARVSAPLEALAASFRRGQLLRNGVTLALAGPPNAGKSSLFNRLLERERAIVTPVAGTTRDTIEESVAVGGIPLRLIDTAGIRAAGEAADEAEEIGIARSHEALADADLVLLIHDATQAVTEEERALAESLAGRPVLRIWNKVDLGCGAVAEGVLGTSAVTGEGIEALRGAILAAVNAEGAMADAGALNNLRQQQAVSETLAALRAAEAANEAGLPHEVILMDLHGALKALDSLTGATTAEDILARIFAAFCIGK